ncbi:MAG: class II glutamine amidotransferase [Oscillospiraceae bacterium]|nr:class II glutamine amidotransferase [Oscillospiraceae bacterium]
MCAVFGFLDYGKKVSARTLKRLLQALSVAAECRGRDATGMSYVKRGKIVTFKKAKPAHKVKLYFPRGTTAVIGHTRFTTQGSEKHNYNNHPFEGKAGGHSFALAHNGVLYNDVKLRREQGLPETKIETDSYIAVQLLEQQDAVDEESLRYMAETVAGNFVFSILRDDNTLFLVKGDNPLTLWHLPSVGLLVYASTDEILQKAVLASKIQSAIFPVPVNADEIICIHPDGSMTRSAFTQQMSPLYFRPLVNWEPCAEEVADYEEELHLLCQCYNADEKEVRALLEFGYGLDEIEELLADGYFPYALEDVRQCYEF